MNPVLYFAGILLVTLAAGALAFALDWLMLRFAFRLMRPADGAQPALVRSTSAAANRRPNSPR